MTDVSFVPDVPEELVVACLEGVMLSAGGGLAIQAGLPSGRELLRRMLDQLGHDEPTGQWEELRSQVDTVDPPLLEEVLESRLDRRRLASLLSDVLKEPTSWQWPPWAVLPMLGRIPFAGVITTNWDHTLDQAFASHRPQILGPRAKGFPSLLRTREFFLLKLYGDLNRPRELVFSPNQFRQAVYENQELARFVASLFATRTLLFLGFSPAGIENLLNAIEIRSRPERTHFALVPSDPGTSLERERMRSRFNIHLLEYGATAGHPEVGRFVRSLSSKISQRGLTTGRPLLRPEVLDELVLRNVGPFSDLRLSFTDSWNVLLGNNGCGKCCRRAGRRPAAAGPADRAGHAPGQSQAVDRQRLAQL